MIKIDIIRIVIVLVDVILVISFLKYNRRFIFDI